MQYRKVLTKLHLLKGIEPTIGIIGGLVNDDAAFHAEVVSLVMVLVVALTAIASFGIPAYSVAIYFRLVCIFFMFAAALLGLYGIILVTLWLIFILLTSKLWGFHTRARLRQHYFGTGWILCFVHRYRS